MRRQGMGWFAAGVLVLASVSCFKDPVKPLQGGAARLTLNRSFANMTVPETLIVTVQAVDAQGNFLAFPAPTYATGAATVATMIPFPDTVIGTIPGNTLYKALLISQAVGNTVTKVTAAGVTDSIVVQVH